MSEQGWKEFLQAEGVTDWVILHGGATAAYKVRSIRESVRLADAIARVKNVEDTGVLITLTDHLVTIRLTRDIWKLETRHIQLARDISLVAREHGAFAAQDRVQEVQVAIAAKADAIDVGFWRAVLGYRAESGDNAVDPLGHGSTVWMQEIAANKTLRHAMHIDVSVASECVKARVEAALAAGGRVVDASQAPAHWTLSDRAGNRVCICGWPDGFRGDES